MIKKEDLLSVTSELRIMEHYTGATNFVKNISSPFTEDKNPSFRVYPPSDKNTCYTFKCHSSGRQGDCYQLVADLNNLDCKNDFSRVLEKIVKDMNLPLNGNTKVLQKGFKVFKKSWTKQGLKFWSDLGVSRQILDAFNVSMLDKFEYPKGKEVKTFKIYQGVLAFSYEINGSYKIYIPEQPTKKVKKQFYKSQSVKDVFGLKELPNSVENLFICAGEKDCLILNSRGFNAISFQSENTIPAQALMSDLGKRAKSIFTVYDNDFDKKNNPGQLAAAKLQEKYPDLINVCLPDNINDIADYFKQQNEANFEELIKVAKANAAEDKGNQKQTIFHITEDYLSQRYEFRYNEIKLDVEYRLKGAVNWESVNEHDLYIKIQKSGINCSVDKLVSILKSDFVEKYNPFIDYFKNLPKWDGNDYIEEYCSYVKAEDQEAFTKHFRKWLVRAVKCATIPSYFNKQAFILVHQAQNSGKSTWCRNIVPSKLSEYLAEDISNDKDARILLCKNLMINLDELAVLSKKEVNSLKAYFSKTQINERLPYDRKNSIINRTCSFIGSTNMNEFLTDETGSVRWLCFSIASIDWNYKTKCDVNKVWAQAVALAKDINFNCEMTPEEIQANEHRNADYQQLTPERELVHKHIFHPSTEKREFLTATEIQSYLMSKTYITRLNRVGIGRAMSQEGFPRVKYGGIYGYWIAKKDDF